MKNRNANTSVIRAGSAEQGNITTKRADRSMRLSPGFPLTALAIALAPLAAAANDQAPWFHRLGVEVSGQMLRPSSAESQAFEPSFIDTFRTAGVDAAASQDDKFGWNDSLALRLNYTPNERWLFSAGIEAGDRRRQDSGFAFGETVSTCAFVEAPADRPRCDQDSTTAGNWLISRSNYGAAAVDEREKHLLVDFQVGRNLGIGSSSAGTVSAGLRYASFQSKSVLSQSGIPDWQLPEDCFDGGFSAQCGKYSKPATRTEYVGGMTSDREFKGFGPFASWQAATRLMGAERGGRLDLDWGVSAGILFGKQTAVVEVSEASATFRQTYFEHIFQGDTNPLTSDSQTIEYKRSEATTVGTLGAQLGLHYRWGAAGIGAGYRWNRYFGVVDGGIEQKRDYDRTLDGPYLSIRVGFGGEGEQ